MTLRIYQDTGGRQYWADSTSPHTVRELSSGAWVLFDDTPDTPPPAPDGFDAAVRDRVTGTGTLTRAALRSLVAGDTANPASAIGAAQRAAFVALAQLAASPDLMASGVITRSSTGAATGFSVVWPDGATGTFTGTESTSAPGAIDSYTVTHVANGVTTTYRQPALTRDATTGAVTKRPAMTVA